MQVRPYKSLTSLDFETDTGTQIKKGSKFEEYKKKKNTNSWRQYVLKQHFGNDLFVFLIDSTTPNRISFISYFFSIISYLYGLTLVMFYDYTEIWDDTVFLSPLAHFLKAVFHPNIADNPTLIFKSTSLYVSIINFVFSLISCISFISFYIKRYLPFMFRYFIVIMCYGFSPLFISYSIGAIVDQIVQFSICDHANSGFIWFPIVLNLISLPTHCIFLIIGLMQYEITINSTISPKQSLMLIYSQTVIICMQAILQIPNLSVVISFWISVIILIISIFITVKAVIYPPNISIFGKIANSYPVVIIWGALYSSFRTLGLPDSANQILSIIFLIAGLISMFSIIAFHVWRHKKVNAMLSDAPEIDPTYVTYNDLRNCYAYCNKENLAKIANPSISRYIETEMAYDFELQIIALRYQIAGDQDLGSALDLAIKILKMNLSSFMKSLQLTTVIESISDSSGSIRQHHIEDMVKSCISHQIDFWSSVILDQPIQVSDNLSRLFFQLRNTEAFFDILRAAGFKLTREYNFFMKNIAANYIPLEGIPIIVEEEDDTQYKGPVSNSLGALGNLSGDDRPRREKVISILPERIKLCKQANSYEIPGMKSKITAIETSLILVALTTILVIAFSSISMGTIGSNTSVISELYTDEYLLFNSTFNLIAFSGSYDSPIYTKFGNFTMPSADELHTIIDMFKDRKTKYIGNELHYSLNRVMHDLFWCFSNQTASAERFDNLSKLAILVTEAVNITYSTFQEQYEINQESFAQIRTFSVVQFTIITVVFIICLIVISMSLSSMTKTLNIFEQQCLSIDKIDAVKVFQSFNKFKNKQRVRDKKNHNKHRLLRLIPLIVLISCFVTQFLVIIIFHFVLRRLVNYNDALIQTGFAIASYFGPVTLMQAISFQPQNKDLLELSVMLEGEITNLRQVGGLRPDPYIEYTSMHNLFPNCYPPIKVSGKMIEDTPIWPLYDNTKAYSYKHSLYTIYLTTDETLYSISISNMTFIEDIVQISTLIPLCSGGQHLSDMVTEKFQFKVYSIKFGVVLGIIVLFAMNLGLTLIGIHFTKIVPEQVKTTARIFALLPEKNIFLEDGVLNFMRSIPESHTHAILDAMPIGFIAVDKDDNIVMRNKFADYLLGEGRPILGKNRKELEAESQRVDVSRRKTFTSTHSGIETFPFHPFDLPPSSAVQYYIYQETTEQSKEKEKIAFLEKELVDFRSFLLPTSVLAVHKGQTDKTVLIDKFASVEVVLPELYTIDNFLNLKERIKQIVSQFNTVFIADVVRQSIFIVFSSFNTQTTNRQYLRDAAKCSLMLRNLLTQELIMKGSKIVASTGVKALCKIVDAEVSNVSFYSNSILKSAKLLSVADPGQLLIEFEMLKPGFDLDVPPSEKFSVTVGSQTVYYWIYIDNLFMSNSSMARSLFMTGSFIL